MEVKDLRNVREASLELSPGLNVLLGRNAQGKTSLLEAVGLLARGRSFRTDQTETLIRRGAPSLRAQATAMAPDRRTCLEVELAPGTRRLRVDGREVPPREYHGRLEVIVYSTDRLRVVRGPMRERRQFLDRSGSALWPAYRQAAREFERVLVQRNAALEAGAKDLDAWNERFVELGARLRDRRASYVDRLRQALRPGFHPEGEAYEVVLVPAPLSGGAEAERPRLQAEMEGRRRDENRARRSLVGPHRDEVLLLVDGEEAGVAASSGQARSLLLALALATLEVYRQETGSAAVALLDDLDSELDETRATELCREVGRRGQALVTTAHAGWARRLADLGRLFEVEAGEVRAA
jgi:DNA replication and repair protein RecF